MELGLFDPYSSQVIEKQSREDHYIASIDPLKADTHLQRLPVLNQKKDTIQLVLMLVDILPFFETAESFDFCQAAAAMRDIGMLLGSLKRHGVEPVNVIPQLEEKLNILAARTNLPPRDTLIHYTIWNPENDRLRSYTGTSDEKRLIESVRIAMHPLLQAIFNLKKLYDIPMDSPDFVAISEKVHEQFSAMVHGVVHAKRFVSPEYFAKELRFYFDPIVLNDRIYLGPGAVEMPVFVFDQILWSSDCSEPIYTEFKNTYLPYIQDHVRDVFQEFEGKVSLATKVSNELCLESEYDENRFNSAKALSRLFVLLKSFRMPHKKLATQAYDHSKEGTADEMRSKGSGGYAPDILQHILQLNEQYYKRLQQSLIMYGSLKEV